jgi:hypothetical protein
VCFRGSGGVGAGLGSTLPAELVRASVADLVRVEEIFLPLNCEAGSV